MKTLSKVALITSVCLMLVACGASVPGCDDKEVRDVLNKISRDNGVTLQKLSGISTASKGDKSCTCTAIATLSEGGQTEDIPIEYIINLADNKKEFTVTMRPR